MAKKDKILPLPADPILSEKQWMDEKVNGRSWGWQELVTCGRASTNNLEDGELKGMLDLFTSTQAAIEKRLRSLGYEAG